MKPTEPRLRDRVEFGDLAMVRSVLMAMHQHFANVCRWIALHVQRGDRSLVLFNLLSATSDYLYVAALNLQTHTSVLALAARSLYELNLRARHVLASDDNIYLWQAEAVRDKIEVLEGILLFQTVGTAEDERAILRAEINRLKGLAAKYKLPQVERIPSTAQIAASVGQSNHHKALFKLFSKIVHPSSYLVNDYKNAASGNVPTILQIMVQLYAWDTFNRICDALRVPGGLRVLASDKR